MKLGDVIALRNFHPDAAHTVLRLDPKEDVKDRQIIRVECCRALIQSAHGYNIHARSTTWRLVDQKDETISLKLELRGPRAKEAADLEILKAGHEIVLSTKHQPRLVGVTTIIISYDKLLCWTRGPGAEWISHFVDDEHGVLSQGHDGTSAPSNFLTQLGKPIPRKQIGRAHV